MGRQNKRSLQLKGARRSKKQRIEERASLQAALSVAAEEDLDLQLPANNESSSEGECEITFFCSRWLCCTRSHGK